MRNESATFALEKTLPNDLLRKMIASGKSVPSTRSATNGAVINVIAGVPNMVVELEPACSEDLGCPEGAGVLQTSKR